MIKLKLFLSFDKEEKWLEKMAAQGWKLEKYGIFYHFEAAEPEKINLKIDHRLFSRKKDFVDYCLLFEDSGWQHILGTKSSGKQFFIRINPNSSEDIFSDAISRASRYKRAFYTISTVLAFSLFFVTLSIRNGTLGIDKLQNPKGWYLTPGLWQMKGVTFLWSFFFETPFALARGLGGVIPLLILLLCAFFSVKFWREYKKTLGN